MLGGGGGQYAHTHGFAQMRPHTHTGASAHIHVKVLFFVGFFVLFFFFWGGGGGNGGWVGRGRETQRVRGDVRLGAHPMNNQVSCLARSYVKGLREGVGWGGGQRGLGGE